MAEMCHLYRKHIKFHCIYNTKTQAFGRMPGHKTILTNVAKGIHTLFFVPFEMKMYIHK